VIKKLVLAAAVLAFVAAAVAAAVVAAAFALYALLAPGLAPPLAAAVVALAFALLGAVAALAMILRARGPRRHRHEPEPATFMERVVGAARERPFLAAGGALAAALIALKNPQVVASIVSAVLAARTAEKVDRSRR